MALFVVSVAIALCPTANDCFRKARISAFVFRLAGPLTSSIPGGIFISGDRSPYEKVVRRQMFDLSGETAYIFKLAARNIRLSGVKSKRFSGIASATSVICCSICLPTDLRQRSWKSGNGNTWKSIARMKTIWLLGS